MMDEPNSSTDDEQPKKRGFLSRLWDAAVECIADFISAVLKHPKVQDAMQETLTVALHGVLEDPGTVAKIENISFAMVNDIGRHKDRARSIGKDAPLLVSGFVGGLMSNVRKSSKISSEADGKTSEVETDKKVV